MHRTTAQTVRRTAPPNPQRGFEQGREGIPKVDLLGRYSNRTSWAKRLHRLPKAAVEGVADTVRFRRRNATRLSRSQVAALVDGYRAGQTVYELAAGFNIHRTTVSAHLHRQGITMRRQGLNDESVAHAVRRYEDGWSVARIGDRLGVDATTAWTAIKAQGIRVRDPHGRER
jgi:lambda repressor-like predicted transcriptional regulator